jgi:hypothetical protein
MIDLAGEARAAAERVSGCADALNLRAPKKQVAISGGTPTFRPLILLESPLYCHLKLTIAPSNNKVNAYIYVY